MHVCLHRVIGDTIVVRAHYTQGSKVRVLSTHYYLQVDVCAHAAPSLGEITLLCDFVREWTGLLKANVFDKPQGEWTIRAVVTFFGVEAYFAEMGNWAAALREEHGLALAVKPSQVVCGLFIGQRTATQ